jgi:hypothetical protein
VRGGDDEIRPRDPAAAGDAEAAGRPEDAYDARRSGAHDGRAEESRIGRPHRRCWADDRGERIDASKQTHELARRHGVVELLQDLGLLRGAPERGLSRDHQCRRSEHPDEREPRQSSEDESADGIQRPQRRKRQRSAKGLPRERPDGLEDHCREGRSGECGQRCPL